MLGGGSYGRDCETIEQVEQLISHSDELVLGPPLPFRPLFRRQDGIWALWCPNLDLKSGRCNDYANRPMCCSEYEPGTDRLCVLHEPA